MLTWGSADYSENGLIKPNIDVLTLNSGVLSDWNYFSI